MDVETSAFKGQANHSNSYNCEGRNQDSGPVMPASCLLPSRCISILLNSGQWHLLSAHQVEGAPPGGEDTRGGRLKQEGQTHPTVSAPSACLSHGACAQPTCWFQHQPQVRTTSGTPPPQETQHTEVERDRSVQPANFKGKETGPEREVSFPG